VEQSREHPAPRRRRNLCDEDDDENDEEEAALQQEDEDTPGSVGGGGGEGGFNTFLTTIQNFASPQESEAVAIPVSEIQEELLNSHEDCWGCICNFGPQRRPGRNKGYDFLWNEYTANVSSMTVRELAKLIFRVHQKHVYNPAIEAGIKCLFWSEDQIYTHILHHMFDNRRILVESVMMYRAVEYKLSQSLLFNKDSTVMAHDKNMKHFQEIGKLKLAYMNQVDKMK